MLCPIRISLNIILSGKHRSLVCLVCSSLSWVDYHILLSTWKHIFLSKKNNLKESPGWIGIDGSSECRLGRAWPPRNQRDWTSTSSWSFPAQPLGVGKVCKPLQSVKLSILSRVHGYGRFEQLDWSCWKVSLIPISLSKTWWFQQRVGDACATQCFPDSCATQDCP